MKKSDKKAILTEIKQKTAECIANRKHANKIVDILGFLQDEQMVVVQAAVRAVNKVFCHFIEVGEMKQSENSDTDNKESQYKVWLHQRYTDSVGCLLDLVQGQEVVIQELALATLMKFVVKAVQYPLSSNVSAPFELYKRILRKLLSASTSQQKLLNMLQEHIEYDDVRFYSLQVIYELIQGKAKQAGDHDMLLNNIFSLLEHIKIPAVSGEESMSNYLGQTSGGSQKMCNVKEHQKLFTSIWVDFLRFKLSTSLYRRALVILHDKVMPYMTNARVLSDFLIDSYNIGGAISLLALNGLFILIQKYNLNYPDFYTKLYALFEPGIFHVKYRARFFYLSDIFLSSTHLPGYLVAAFAKRLSRICLSAPPSGLLIAIPFVYNLINRHPVCKQMINRPDDENDYTTDPYLPEETDPAKCEALKSCLWEIKSLQRHYHSEVARAALKIDTALPDNETELSNLLDTTTDDLIERCGKKMKTVAVTFEAPTGLIGGRDDRLQLGWTL